MNERRGRGPEHFGGRKERREEPPAARSAPSLAYRSGAFAASARDVPLETAVAIAVEGTTHAVMMATPRDLEELAIGLALNEQIVARADDIEQLEIAETERGVDCRLWLNAERAGAYQVRRRMMTGPVGCGLCGVESLELAAPELPVVGSRLRVAPSELIRAMAEMAERQALGRLTRAVHAAGFGVSGRGLVAVHEDVGRHNALDKVAGRLAFDGIDPADGFLVITSRVSVELIQKAAVMGCPLIAAVSAPTDLAIRTAEAAGVTLVAVARGEEFEIFSHPERVAA